MVAKVLAVIGGNDDDCVVQVAAVLELVKHPADMCIQCLYAVFVSRPEERHLRGRKFVLWQRPPMFEEQRVVAAGWRLGSILGRGKVRIVGIEVVDEGEVRSPAPPVEPPEQAAGHFAGSLAGGPVGQAA